MSIYETLIPALHEAFPDRTFKIDQSPKPIVTFPEECADVGGLLIYDDGDEATVVIENVTHHHTNPYDEEMSVDERSHWITERVVNFLNELFEDKVFLWSVNKGNDGGGWRGGFDGNVPDDIPPEADIFVWSHRLERKS